MQLSSISNQGNNACDWRWRIADGVLGLVPCLRICLERHPLPAEHSCRAPCSFWHLRNIILKASSVHMTL